MKDRSNLSKEQVRKMAQKKGPVGMALPRSDDGNVHKAAGPRDNSSAAHYADAMSHIGGQASPARKLASGN